MKTETFRRFAAVLWIFLFIAGFSAAPVLGQGETPAQASASHMRTGEDYHIGSGDLIRVVVWRNEEVSGEFRVRPDGKFSMPLIGDILAGGSTTDSISMQVEQKLKLFIEAPHVSVIVAEAASNRVYIMGEVVRPGTYPIDGDLSVLQALALAGGFTEFASREKMVLVRGVGQSQRNIPLSYTKILREPGEAINPVLERGDTLVVP